MFVEEAIPAVSKLSSLRETEKIQRLENINTMIKCEIARLIEGT